VRAVLDRDPSTSWSTETYQGGNLGKAGVGVYVDAKPGVSARKLIVQTPTPGWSGRIYAAKDPRPTGAPPSAGWEDLGPIGAGDRKTEVTLDTGDVRLRYYLIWITKLPTGKESAEISEISLFRDG
jgi:serine/threonine-protein kinase